MDAIATIKRVADTGTLKAIPRDHPHRRKLAELERDVTDAMTAALDQYRRDIFRDVTRSNVYELAARAESPELNARLRQSIYDALLKVAAAGGDVGKAQIEAEVFGVKAAPFDAGIAIDWELVNTAVADWARAMSFDLTYANEYSISQRTARGLRAAIASFVESSDMSMSELARQVESLFDAVRGEMIAVTEVTRAFAAGNQAAWEQSKVVEGKQWNTAVDELVCPICGPLNGKVVKLNETFGGFYDYPPAHPRCRCWISPVTIAPENINPDINRQLADIDIAEMFQSTPDNDPFYHIRPPEGRAPRGMGQEYADRRWIANSLGKAQKYRGTAQNKLESYRGQRNRAWEISVAQTRVAELTKAINASLDIVDTNADWAFKRDMVSAIMEYVSQLGMMSS